MCPTYQGCEEVGLVIVPEGTGQLFLGQWLQLWGMCVWGGGGGGGGGGGLNTYTHMMHVNTVLYIHVWVIYCIVMYSHQVKISH